MLLAAEFLAFRIEGLHGLGVHVISVNSQKYQ